MGGDILLAGLQQAIVAVLTYLSGVGSAALEVGKKAIGL